MYKITTLTITLLALSLFTFAAYLILPISAAGDLRIMQMSFNYIPIILLGLLSGGIIPLKNKFAPYHLAQISVSTIYVITQLLTNILLFSSISYNALLLVNLCVLFIFGSILIVLNLANAKSCQKKNEIE